MNKCTNCGTEFEGKYCPECGQKWVDASICPKCGSKLDEDVKYCPECGRRVGQTSVNEKPEPKERKRKSGADFEFAKKLNGFLRYVPVALALLFAVMLPLLYIAPIVEANEIFGATESINVYSLEENFYGVSVAYIVFMCIAFLLAVVSLYLYVNEEKRQKYVKLFGKIRITFGELAALLAVVLVYLPCLIISAVAMGDAAELNELLGGGLIDVVYAGAAPKAVLSIAVIFTVFVIGASIAQLLIEKANPELLPIEEEEQTDVTPCKKPLLYYAFLNAKLRAAAFAFFVCSFLTALVFLGFCMFAGLNVRFSSFRKLNWIIVIGSIITALITIANLTFDAHTWSPDDFVQDALKKDWSHRCKHMCKLGIKKIIVFVIPLMAMIYIYLLMGGKALMVYGRGYIIATVYIALSVIIYIVAKIAIYKQSCAIAEQLVRAADAGPEAPLQIVYDKEQEHAAYKAYEAAKKHGVVIADDDNTKRIVFKRRLVLSLACCIFVAMSIITAVVPSFLYDKFSASYVSRVVDLHREGDSFEGMLYSFDEPNEIKDLGQENGYTGYTRDVIKYMAMYYDDDYAKLNKQAEQLQKQIEKAQAEFDLNKASKLNNQLQSLKNSIARLEFNSLTITYYNTEVIEHSMVWTTSNNDIDYRYYIYDIIQIALNTKTTVGKTQKKTAKSVKLFDAKYSEYGYTADEFFAEIFYTDGSYKYERVPTYAFSAIDFTKTGKQTVKWSDDWGSYSATVYN